MDRKRSEIILVSGNSTPIVEHDVHTFSCNHWTSNSSGHDGTAGPTNIKDNSSWISTLDNGAFLVNARALVSDLEGAMGLTFSDIEAYKDIDTVGGLIFTISGKIPKKDEIIPDPKLGINFKILEANDRKVFKVLVFRGESIGEK